MHLWFRDPGALVVVHPTHALLNQCRSLKQALINRGAESDKSTGHRPYATTLSAGGVQMAEAALADEWVRHGDRLALQRRVLRLGKPPRRWRRPPWASQALQEPCEVGLA